MLGEYLYVGNRGHNSIAGFAVDTSGRLTAAGHASTEPVPSAFCLAESIGRLSLSLRYGKPLTQLGYVSSAGHF